MPERCALIITAADFGYSPRYDEGIVEAADAGAVDSVSVMVNRNRLDPELLLETGAETGLHLDLPLELTEGQGAGALGPGPWSGGRGGGGAPAGARLRCGRSLSSSRRSKRPSPTRLRTWTDT